jgi:hypothetical protein
VLFSAREVALPALSVKKHQRQAINHKRVGAVPSSCNHSGEDKGNSLLRDLMYCMTNDRGSHCRWFQQMRMILPSRICQPCGQARKTKRNYVLRQQINKWRAFWDGEVVYHLGM